MFKLHDTYGMPPDLTQIIAREKGFDVDLSGYEKKMEEQRSRSEFVGKDKAIADVYLKLSEKLGPVEFLGYDGRGVEGEGTLRAIIKNGQLLTEARAGDEVELVFDRTPFYGESGGQIGDTGRALAHGGKAEAEIVDAQKPTMTLIVHKAKVKSGVFRVGDVAQLSVDGLRREMIRANHSATHLLHKALKLVLGEHVKQAGSVVAPDHLRFDYTHFQAPSGEQLERIEDVVNQWIRDNAEAQTRVMGLEEAKKSGAVALFGEKYGERVRVVSVHPESTELCGGTHVRRTGDIGLITVLSDSGVAAGVRRIEALTGRAARKAANAVTQLAKSAAAELRSPVEELPARIATLLDERKRLERELAEARKKLAMGGGKAADNGVRTIGDVKLMARAVEGIDIKDLRSLADEGKKQLGSGVVAIVGVTAEGKAGIVVGVTDDLTKRFSAVDLVRRGAEALGGKGGGGRPDMAQAGGPDGSKASAALKAIEAALAG